MATQKISLANMQGKLSRTAMKNIVGGTATLPGCENGQTYWVCGSTQNGDNCTVDFCYCSTGLPYRCDVPAWCGAL